MRSALNHQSEEGDCDRAQDDDIHGHRDDPKHHGVRAHLREPHDHLRGYVSHNTDVLMKPAIGVLLFAMVAFVSCARHVSQDSRDYVAVVIGDFRHPVSKDGPSLRLTVNSDLNEYYEKIR